MGTDSCDDAGATGRGASRYPAGCGGICALAIELLAVTVIATTMVLAFGMYFWNRWSRADDSHYQSFRARLGSGLLLGLEILVAADVIRTVAFEPTLESVAILGLLVVIRTFLSWALVVEIEERWPWQARKPE